ncbi:MAG: winged helix-turn-helix transcriptional regulator, partial [Deltaproteobacteria bacterium]|nr:winged helix-turn-helix transcriptional regulator [Deltaproteobacteria bacterium]
MPRSIKAQRTVDLAAASIREAILGGEYPPGSWLPPERSLAGTLGINRLTLRAALARLQAEGLVRPEQGNGVLVLDYRGTAGLELLPYLATAGGGG